MRYDLEIGFEEAVFGLNAEIQVPRMEACGHCRGTGAEPGSGASTCPTCRGRGEVIYQQSFLSIRRTCGTCGGRARSSATPCGHCRGQGYQQAQRKLKVNIPAGVDEGTRLRMGGEGRARRQWRPSGRSLRFPEGQGSPFLRAPRERPVLHHSAEPRASGPGMRYRGPTLEKPHKLNIPEGTQNGASFRLRGKGVPKLNGGGGATCAST